ncbi:MAG: hypothetical protein WBX50_04645 [Candidatus Deferrimicrobiaceae bacterium]
MMFKTFRAVKDVCVAKRGAGWQREKQGKDKKRNPEVVVSGIEEIKYMEDHLMTGMELPG